MHFSEQVTLTPRAICIPAKDMELIGIGDNSRCWAVWMPRWRNAKGDPEAESASLPHLLISPFHPKTWPTLFRFVVKIQNRPGALKELTAVLSNERFNVISHHCAPSGHNHVTVNMVGISLNILEQAVLKEYANFALQDRRLGNPKFTRYASKKLAKVVLEEALRLETSVLRAHKERDFLRETFIAPDELNRTVQHRKSPRGLAFDPEQIPEDLAKHAPRSFLRAVSCEWLQYPAFFWLYGANTDDPIEFVFDARRGQLNLTKDDDASKYAEHVQPSLRFPIKTIGSIDTQAHYVRLMLSEFDKTSQIEIIIQYRAESTRGSLPPNASLGLLNLILDVVHKKEIRLRRVSNRLVALSPQVEEAELHLIAQPCVHRTIDEDYVSDLQHAFGQIKPPSEYLKLKPAKIKSIGTEKIFVSCKYHWWKNVRPTFGKELSAHFSSHGIEIDTSPNLAREDRGDYDPQITQDAENAIIGADGFLPSYLTTMTQRPRNFNGYCTSLALQEARTNHLPFVLTLTE